MLLYNVMRFYVFISALLSFFGAFTVVFVVTSAISNKTIATVLAIALTLFFIFTYYTLAKKIRTHKERTIAQEKKIHTLQNKLMRIEDDPLHHFHTIMMQIEKPAVETHSLSQMLLKSKLPAKLKKAQQTIAKNSATLVHALQKHHQTITLEQNTPHPYGESSAKTIASNLVDTYRKKALQKGLLLSFTSDVDSQTIVPIEARKLEMLLSELLDNALHYTTRGSITVYVHDNPKKKYLFIDVIDSGIGLSEEEQEDIFCKFKRGDAAVTMHTPGAGLGLYNAKLLVQQHQGDIYAYSQGQGQGSTIRVRLPLLL